MATTWNRRDFLKTGSAATLAALAAGAPMASMLSGCSLTGSKIKPTADTVILLWMAGGMAHTETFDPKHYEPYKKGMDANGRSEERRGGKEGVRTGRYRGSRAN